MLQVRFSTLIVTLFFIGCGSVSTETTTTLNSDSITEVTKPEQQEILKAINKARSVTRDCHDGLGLVGPAQPLTWNDALYASAHEHSYDLAQSNTFDHIGSGTNTDITGSNSGNASIFYERIEANGYTEYSALGENIAGGQTNIEEVMEAWLESPAHCKNIMSNMFTEVGVAIVINQDSDFGIYWTQNFGSKK
jgi:uncharacterized protein YkwD